MNDKQTVLERLARRDAQRIESMKKKHDAKAEETPLNEKLSYFESVFREKSNLTESLITQIPTIEKLELSLHFDMIKNNILELQKLVISSSIFLKDYDMRKYLGIVQNLDARCYELEEKFIPRKKFGFSKKKTEKVVLECSLPQRNDIVDGKEKTHKYEETLYGFDNRENEVLRLEEDDVFQRDVSVRNCTNCTLCLKGVLGTLHLSNLDNCIILCGPVCTSVFLEKCMNCKIVIACQQMRMHSSTKCDVYLHVTSKGIIEDCSNIRTSPYNLKYDSLEKHFEVSTLDKNKNNWNKLDDFNWLSIDTHSPNWSIMNESDRVIDWTPWWSKTPTQ